MKKQNEKLANAKRTFTKDSKAKVDVNHSKYTSLALNFLNLSFLRI